MDDLVLLRALGLAAVPYGGLQRLTARQFDALAEQTDGFPPARRIPALRGDVVDPGPDGWVGSPEAYRPKCDLVLVPWSVRAREREYDRVVIPVVRHLLEGHHYLDGVHPCVDILWPTTDEMSNLQFRHRLRDAPLIRDLLRDGLRRFPLRDLPRPDAPPREPTHDFVDGYMALVAARENVRLHPGLPRYTKRLARAQADYDRLIEEMIMRPLAAHVQATRHPVLKCLLFELLEALQPARALWRQLETPSLRPLGPSEQIERAEKLAEYSERLERVHKIAVRIAARM